MRTLTPARDRLHAFHAANPDVSNADGEQLLELPKSLLDEHDTLLAAAIAEQDPPIRTVNLGSIPTRSTDGRFAAVFTLTYEIRQPDGEWTRIVRGTDARGIEVLGRKLMLLSDDIVVNIAVTNRAGTDCTFDFECFWFEAPEVSRGLRDLAYGLMSFVPSEPVAV